MKFFRSRLTALAVAFIVALAACSKQAETPKSTAATVATGPVKPIAALPQLGPAPAWKLQDVNGKEISSEQFRGKVVVVDFWATWCGPCREEIPGYIALQKKYGPDKLAIVGVSMDQAGPEVVKTFIAKNGVNYQMVMADDAVQTAFGGFEAIPTTFLIDQSGQIRDKKTGSEETAEYERKIASLLN